MLGLCEQKMLRGMLWPISHRSVSGHLFGLQGVNSTEDIYDENTKGMKGFADELKKPKM